MKVKKQENFSKPGKIYNEDRAAFNKDSAWVIDGASGLAGNVITETSDAAWYSEWWNNYLLKNANDFSRSLKEILQNGLELITKEYAKLTEGKELVKLAKPSAGMVIVRKKGKKLEYLTLGDCMLVVKKGDEIKKIMLPELEQLDKNVINYMTKIYKEGKYTSIIATRQDEEVKNRLAENRLKLNTPNGYWVMSFQPEAIDNALTGTIENDNLQVLLMTDGFYAITNSYKYVDFKGLFNMIEQKGVKEVYSKLRQLEENDADCNAFPRFKKSDDASVVYMELEPEL